MSPFLFYGLFGFGAHTVQPFEATLTVPSGAVAADLTDFPVMVQLADMPAPFWNSVKQNGGDIRVKTTGGTVIPHDLVRINYGEQEGLLFFKANLATASDNDFLITCGDRSLSKLAVDDANGRNAVWSDYHRVYEFTENVDRTGSGGAVTLVNGAGHGLLAASKTADLDFHQGVAWSATRRRYYMVDTDELVSYDEEGNEIARNATPLADTGLAGVNHCGDPEIYGTPFGEVLLVPVEEYPNSPYDNQHIAAFDPDTLEFIDSADISVEGREIATFGHNPDDGLLYVGDFTNGASLMKYALNWTSATSFTATYQGVLALSTTISEMQGITFWDGYLWINSDALDRTHKFQTDGTYIGRAFTSLYGGNWEGLSHNDTGLLSLVDAAAGVGGVYHLRPAEDMHPGFLGLGGNSYWLRDGVTKFTDWTMGVTAILNDRTASAGHVNIISYGVNSGVGATDTASRASVLQRTNTSINFGTHNSTDSWLMSAVASVDGQAYRLVVTQQDTTDRKLYVDGVGVTDTGCAQRPANNGDVLYGGMNQITGGNAEFLRGAVNFVYLRNGELAADWLAAEADNVIDPGSFYTVTEN